MAVASDVSGDVSAVEFRILGSLEVADGRRSVDLRRAKPRAVLAMLLLHPNQVVPVYQLLDALWGDSPPPSATNTLQGYVSQLRSALAAGQPATRLAPVIRTQAPGYRLTVDPEHVDAHRFERMAKAGRSALAAGDAQRAAGLLGDALALWRGPALVDFTHQSFGSVAAARLEELRLAALEDQTEAGLALGHHAQLVCPLQAQAADHPFRERLWGQLMLALYRCGRQAEALRAFQSAAETLREGLGIDPNPKLRRLEADMLAQAPYLDWKRRPDGAGGGATQVPFPVLLATGSSVDYVGRPQLLQRLTDAWRQATGGRPRAVLLAGEPGVGKTRTAAEVARSAFAEGAVVLYGHCDEDVAVPYQPFVEMLDWYTTHAAEPVLGRHPAELTRLQPLLASRVADLGVPVSSDARSEEHLLFEATSSWLIELANEQPVVLVLDDLHWVTKPVLLLLRHVLRSAAARGQGTRLLVLATYRDTEVDHAHPVAGLEADLRRLAIVDRWAVAGLTLAEVEEFVSRAAGHDLDDGTRRLSGTLHAETEGNPFFMGEVLRHLRETGVVRRAEGRWVLDDLAGVTVPEGVRDVVGRRVARLSAPAIELLTVAAVLGRDFDVELLAALSDLPEKDLLDALDESLGARLIAETDSDRYRFAHALVRATLAEKMSATRRRRLHRRAGEALEKLRPDEAVALAHHFTEAGPDAGARSLAIRYSLAAGEQALTARALADAEGQFRHVLELLARTAAPRGTEHGRALCGLGEAQRDQGDPGFRVTLLEAAVLAQAVDDVPLLVSAVLSNSRGVPSVIGGLDAERVAVTEAALEAVGPEACDERARLLAHLASEISFTRDDRRRLALADEAERMARALGDPGLLAWVLNRTGYAAYGARRVDRLVARGEEATRLSDATGDPAQRVLSRFFWSAALLTAGDLPNFRRVTEEMGDVAGEAAPTLQWLALASQARLHTLDGDAVGMSRVNDAAFQLAQELCEPDGPAWWTATRAMLAWCQGGFWSLADALRAGIQEYPNEPAWSIGYAMSLAMDGKRVEARVALSAAQPDPAELLDHVFPFLNTMLCAVVAYHLDDVELATRTAAALRPYPSSWVHHYAGTMGPASIGLALCAAAVGDLDQAVAWCEEAERALVGFGCPGPLSQLRSYYAEILLRRGSGDDRARALDLLERVRVDAADLDAPDLVLRADLLVARASGAR